MVWAMAANNCPKGQLVAAIAQLVQKSLAQGVRSKQPFFFDKARATVSLGQAQRLLTLLYRKRRRAERVNWSKSRSLAVGRSGGRSGGRSVGREVGRVVGRLVGRSGGRSVGRSVGQRSTTGTRPERPRHGRVISHRLGVFYGERANSNNF